MPRRPTSRVEFNPLNELKSILRRKQRGLLLDYFLDKLDKMGRLLRLGEFSRFLVSLGPLVIVEQRDSPQGLVKDTPKSLETDFLGSLGAALPLGWGFLLFGLRGSAFFDFLGFSPFGRIGLLT